MEMSRKRTSRYDKTDAYNKDVVPLLEQLQKVCFSEKIPFVACCAVANNAKETVNMFTVVSAQKTKRTLTDDKIADFAELMHKKTTEPMEAFEFAVGSGDGAENEISDFQFE